MDVAKPDTSSETMYRHLGSAPSVYCANVTADDDNDLDPWARALRIGVAGDVTIQNARGESVEFIGVGAGEIIPCIVRRLMATGTDATDFVAFYG
jgi:hypothetical protein